MLKIFRALYLFLNIAIIIALLTIHFFYKENSYQNSLLYYTFPLPIIILIVLFLAIFLNKKLKKYNLLIAFILLVIWLGRSFKIHFSEDIKETDLEVVFWNASHNRDFDDAFNINNSIPDVLVLVEDGVYNLEDFKLKYPKYYFHESIRGISIFSKTPLKILDEITSNHKTNIINFEVDGICFYAVDVSASMDVPRSWELSFVNEYIKIKEKTVLLGDFNIPFESKFLTNIKANFNHAFNKKGNGFRETWFWNIPLLSLDHIWVSKDLKILKTEKVNTWKSDHSMLKVFIAN